MGFFDGFSTGKHQAQDCASTIFNYDVYDYIYMNKTCVKPYLRRPARYVFKCKIYRKNENILFSCKIAEIETAKSQ